MLWRDHERSRSVVCVVPPPGRCWFQASDTSPGEDYAGLLQCCHLATASFLTYKKKQIRQVSQKLIHAGGSRIRSGEQRAAASWHTCKIDGKAVVSPEAVDKKLLPPLSPCGSVHTITYKKQPQLHGTTSFNFLVASRHSTPLPRQCPLRCPRRTGNRCSTSRPARPPASR